LKRLGKVLHLSTHGHLIIRSDDGALPRMNSSVLTKKMEKIGIVYDIFGPEKDPYISVKLAKNFSASKVKALINDRVYTA
jgi:RNA-binding protein